MKRLLFISLVLISTFAQSQSNTLPTIGNVGIGTTSPTNKLQVNGSVRIDSTLLVKDSMVVKKNLRVEQNVKFIGNTTMNGNVKLNGVDAVNNYQNKSFLVLNENNYTKKISFDSIAPLLKNLVYGNNVVGGQALDICDLATYLDKPTWLNGSNKIYSPCPEVFVGVGTDQPRVPLDIHGKAYVGKLTIGEINPTSSPIFFHLYDNLSTASNQSTLFLIENSERKLFQINNDGIVRTREVIVNIQNNWPDYVFDRQYQLMPLKEVAQYIEENGHLPSVPKAEDILNHGIELGEMNRLLMEKVEELTLHLIAQEKRINALEKRRVKKQKD